MRHYSIVDECILEIIHELVMVITSENNEFIMNGRSVLYYKIFSISPPPWHPSKS